MTHNDDQKKIKEAKLHQIVYVHNLLYYKYIVAVRYFTQHIFQHITQHILFSVTNSFVTNCCSKMTQLQFQIMKEEECMEMKYKWSILLKVKSKKK